MKKSLTVIWEVTKRCNFSCAHCLVDACGQRSRQREFTTREGLQLLHDLSELEVSSLAFSGGEPLLRHDLEKFITEGNRLGFNLSVATNGYLLDDKRAHSLRQAGLTNLQISIDGSNPQEFYTIRKAPKDAFERCWRGVYAAQKAGIFCSVGLFLHPCNIDSVPGFVEVLASQGVNMLRFCGLIPLGRGGKAEFANTVHFSIEQMVRFIRYIQYYDAQRTGVQLVFDHGFGPTTDKFTCSAGTSSFYVTADGNTYPCPAFKHPEFACGNVLHEKVKDIWLKPQMRKCRISYKDIDGPCAECEYISTCQGGCRGTSYAMANRLNSSFENCLFNFQRRLQKTRPDLCTFCSPACHQARCSQANSGGIKDPS